MPDTFVPWEKYPDLKPERLMTVASILRNVRDDLATLHDPGSGDGVWSFGCRAYERTIFALTEASKKYEWLTILPDKEKPLRFTFAIGSTPFRFYRGEPEEPPSRYLLITFEEFKQRQLLLDLDIPADTLLRLAVETDSTGRATTISVVELNELRLVTGLYAIPFEPRSVVIPLRSRPIETPPPVVQPLDEQEDSSASREERNASGL